MIDPKNDLNNDERNDVTIVGNDFFTDSESFLNELTDNELEQVRGGTGRFGFPSNLSLLGCNPNSTASLLGC